MLNKTKTEFFDYNKAYGFLVILIKRRGQKIKKNYKMYEKWNYW